MRNLDAINALLEKLKRILQPMPDLNEELYNQAFASIGHDLSTVAANEVACAEAVSRIIQKAFPELKFPTILSTKELFLYLASSPSWEETGSVTTGGIMMAVTGTGALEHGHVAILGKYKGPDDTFWAMSNDSRSGAFEPNYTVGSFMRYYKGKGKMPIHFFVRT